MDAGKISPVQMLPQHEALNSPPTGAVVKNEWNLIFAAQFMPLLCAEGELYLSRSTGYYPGLVCLRLMNP